MQGKQIFIGPDGSQFMTRRLAIKHMIGEGYSWQEDGLLPRAWRFKTVAGGSGPGKEHLKFLTAEAEAVGGIEPALKMVEAEERFTEQEVDNLKVFIDILRVRARSVRYNWKEDDDTIPEGRRRRRRR